MSIKVISINGQHPKLDYARLESTFEELYHLHCNEATILVINQFPVPIASESNIDVILVIAVENVRGNFIRFNKQDQPVYLHNLIIPVKIVSDFTNAHITQLDGHLLADDAYLDFSKEISALTYNFKKYLTERCGFFNVYIHPFVFLENNHSCVSKHLVVHDKLDFHAIHAWLRRDDMMFLNSYDKWKTNYESVEVDLQHVIDKASHDAAIGYFTKAKIERLGKELSSKNRLFNVLGKEMIMIEGKAGSGKTSELLALSLKALSNGRNPYFLTYNRLLVFDLTIVFRNAMKLNEGENYATITTLHSFFFDLTKKLGVLAILSAERIQELEDSFKRRTRICYNFIQNSSPKLSQENSSAFKSEIQNSAWDKGTKETGVDLVNFLCKRSAFSKSSIQEGAKQFYKKRIKALAQMEASDVFLKDYYGVLKETLLAMKSPHKFHEKYDVKSKADIIDLATGKAKSYVDEKNEISSAKFETLIKRSIGGRRGKNRILFVDEAQDCHHFEKEILVELYRAENIVIANGGKEQLIRHVDLCNWNVIPGARLNPTTKNKRNKSFRLKPAVAQLCNFFSNEYGINLNLESLDTADSGEVIIDFRKEEDAEQIGHLFDVLISKGNVNGCLPYESLLVLLESLDGADSETKEIVQINEFDNIEFSNEKSRGTWKWIPELVDSGIQIFDGTLKDKSQLPLPYGNEVRVIYYESCRGLESWSVACFDLDVFFEKKMAEDDAEKFLIDSEKEDNMQDLFITNDERKRIYAATWVLMAMTRAIDTIYIKISDANSELGRTMEKFLATNPLGVSVKR